MTLLNMPDQHQMKTIMLISARAMSDLKINSSRVMLDVAYCHANGCPLRLRELLQADAFNFAHDIHGISMNIDRTTGKLKNKFKPRMAV